ncbi:MAG: protein kinase [Thermoanaerobaculia bacterium]
MIGTSLSHFNITAKLGEGGMGKVYLAEDSKLGREVAIKVLPEAFTMDPDRLARFKREAEVLASLNHQNIAGIHEIGHENNSHFLVLELVPGETLAELLARGPIPVEEALKYALEIARALEAAHARGVIHRDLKPQNVKITPSGAVKLLDFGLAKVFTAHPEPPVGEATEALTADAQLTATGTILGTAAYMSPEQIRGESVDQRTDIWAFGSVLFEMLAGKRPFGRGSTPDTLAAILKEEVDLTALPSGITASVQTLVRRCLRKPTDRRLHHIADARIELEEALENIDLPDIPGDVEVIPGATAPDDVVQPGWRLLVKVVVGMVLLAALTAAIWYLAPNHKEAGTIDRSIAVLPFETLGQKEATVFTKGIHGDMLTRLSKVADLRVTSRTSVMQFQGSDTPLPEIARELRVTWILRGEVQVVGDQVQVNARLVNGRQDRQVWAESYRRKLTAENLFEIQGELTREIVDQLAGQLSPDEEQAVGQAPTADLDAYRLYVQGRALVEQRTEDELRRAVEYFQQAIDRDSGYALAWAGLSDALALQGFYNYAQLEAVLPEALEAARRAQRLDPDLAEAHASLGIVHSLRRDGPTAVRELRLSVKLNPSYAEAYAWLGWLEDLLGHPEKALVPAKRSVELNPLAPAYRVFLAEAYLANGAYESALGEAKRARQLQSDYALAHYMEGLVLFHLNQLEEADAALGRALSLALPQGTPARSEIQAALALTHAAAGDRAAARKLLAQIDATAEPFAAGLVYAGLGEIDEALDRFDSVREWGFGSSSQVRYFYPEVLGPLRMHPRFEDILRQVNRSWGK